MESNVVSLAAGIGAVDAKRPAPVRPTPGPEQPTAPDRPAPARDAEFLARRAAAESTGGLRDTFARFVIDRESHQVSVQIVDASNQEVIRTIPSDELRQMAQRYRATNGLVLDSAV